MPNPDVDVLDAAWAPANQFAPEGGLLPDQLAACVGEVTKRFAVAAAAVAFYDPAFDREDRVLGAALGFLELVASSRGPDVHGSSWKACFAAPSTLAIPVWVAETPPVVMTRSRRPPRCAEGRG